MRAPLMERLAHHRAHRRFVGDRRGDRERLAARRDDLFDDALGGLVREIVDDDAGALARKIQRMRSPQTHHPHP